jgi:hypothetical protein
MSDLVICKLSDCTCSVAGGKEIILLCEKVAKGKCVFMKIILNSNIYLLNQGFATTCHGGCFGRKCLDIVEK